MNLKEITSEIGTLRNWSLGNNCIMKIFEFKDFKETMDFVNKVAEISEKENHHPDIYISQNRVRLMLTTQSVKELTPKDFETARKVDGLG